MGAFLLGILIGCTVFALVRAGQLTGLKKQLADALGRASHFERMSADLGGRLQAADNPNASNSTPGKTRDGVRLHGDR